MTFFGIDKIPDEESKNNDVKTTLDVELANEYGIILRRDIKVILLFKQYVSCFLGEGVST